MLGLGRVEVVGFGRLEVVVPRPPGRTPRDVVLVVRLPLVDARPLVAVGLGRVGPLLTPGLGEDPVVRGRDGLVLVLGPAMVTSSGGL